MSLISFSGRIGSGKDTAAQIVQELYPDMNWQIKGFADKLRQVASLFLGIPPEELKKQEVKEVILGEDWDYAIRYDNILSIDDAMKQCNGDGFTWDDNCHQRMTIRMFLQWLGTNAIRDNLHPNSWVNALMVGYKDTGPYKWNPGSYANTCLECTNIFYNGAKLQRICEECCKTVGAKFPNWLITDCRFPNEVEAIKSRGGTCFRIIRPDNPYPQSTHESETAIDHIEMPTIINDGNLEQLKLRIREAVEPIIKNAKSH